VTAPALTLERRTTLARLADAIAPAAAGMPSASDISLARESGLIDRVLALRPDLARRLPALLDALLDAPAGAEPDAALARLQADDPAGLDALMQAVAGAYYLDGQVKRRIGYRGQEALTLDRGGFGGEDLLLAMMERPPRWRDPAAELAARSAPARRA
jgi:hypothetical protein